MKKLKNIFIIIICVSVASQIHFNVLIQGFTIAFSVVVFSIFLYNYVDLNPIKIAIITGITTSLYKSFWLYWNIMSFSKVIKMTAPEIVFYVTYGIIFYFSYYKSRKKELTKFMILVFCCDFLSNLVEISVRTKLIGINSNIIKDLLIVACVRTLITLIILIAMKYYKSFLIREEHEERYRRLILLTSAFKSEVYFMNKNAAEIEDVMKKSFSAYQIVSKNHYPDELKNLTLDISKDVHEIKKDYIRVMRGLEEITNDKIDTEPMNIRDIINILEIDTKDYIVTKNLDIELKFKVDCEFYVLKHFYLMSIIRNLIFNSIEAIDNKKKGLVKLKIEKVEDEYVFSVSDNGTGINSSNLNFIFNPGFSTKYNKETGSICRGIGLTLVRDLAQDIFKGNIFVQSIENKNTIFTVKIPITSFRR